MKHWLILGIALIIAACTPGNNRGIRPSSNSAYDSDQAAATVLSAEPNGVTVASSGNGENRSIAEKKLLRRAIKEAAPKLVENIYDSDSLSSYIAEMVNKQQAVDYEDLVKRRRYSIDTEQDGEYFLEGKVVLNNSFLTSRLQRFVARPGNTCASRLSVYITPDATAHLSSEDLKLGRTFMHSLQDYFTRARFDVKGSNQQGEAQYQVNLTELNKVESGLNINFHFTVEVLDNRSAGALFASKQDSASATIVTTGDPEFTKIKALKRAAQKVGAALAHQIITTKISNEIVFYAQGDYSGSTEQQLASGLSGLFNISTNEILSSQSTSQNGFTNYSFEVPVSNQSCGFDFKNNLAKIQKQVFKSTAPKVEVAKSGKKWSVFDSANAPPELGPREIAPPWAREIEGMISQGKLDSPYGAGNNAYDTLKARLRAFPGDPSAIRLLHDLSNIFLEQSENALAQHQTAQARRYAQRAQTIWPENPAIGKIETRIHSAPPPAPIPSYTPQETEQRTQQVASASPEDGKKVLQQGQYWAVLIANQDYQNGVPPLETPLNDARSLKDVLIGSYGFQPDHVKLIENGTREGILNELNRTLKYVKENDSLLIFYAGHGVLDHELGFWVPVDGVSPLSEDSTDHLSSWISNSQIHDTVNVSKAKHVLLISDSCYSGKFKPRTRGLGRTHSTEPDVADRFLKLLALSSRTAMTSGDLEPVADGGGNGHSLFAAQLLRVLGENKTMSAKALFGKIAAKIKSQSPQYFVVDQFADKGGDFIFTKM